MTVAAHVVDMSVSGGSSFCWSSPLIPPKSLEVCWDFCCFVHNFLFSTQSTFHDSAGLFWTASFVLAVTFRALHPPPCRTSVHRPALLVVVRLPDPEWAAGNRQPSAAVVTSLVCQLTFLFLRNRNWSFYQLTVIKKLLYNESTQWVSLFELIYWVKSCWLLININLYKCKDFFTAKWK